ncbi:MULTISPECIES: hypothetical protein [Pseudanabaena]|uniref:hypothetical protein n=1 Tax=Pseudanabaena TaxID=1152 RepID=UPI0024790214|nr:MULTISPECIES: hypothetical protein [Pseudanabaena]MEA5486183.1 hypothetical protein [Pseudanabaena sp. CCNP1317]WGS70559.1 hypothetical protein OA858_12545 [Pseudanabaena galeata CCNP1313]
MFANLIIAIVATQTHIVIFIEPVAWRKSQNLTISKPYNIKEKASQLLRCFFFSFIDISIANSYLNCRGDFPKESATITHKAKLEQAKAEITPKKKLFHTITILLFS